MNPQVVRLLIRDRRNKGWFRVSNDIWLMEISKFAKLIYCYLARCAEDASTCNPSFPDIRRKTGCSHGTIVKALQELKAAKLIKPKPQIGTSTEYEIFDPVVEKTQSTGDRPLPSHGLTVPQSPVGLATQSPVDRKEDLVLNKTEVNKTLSPAPNGGAPKSAQAFQVDGLLPVVAVAVDALEVPTPGSAARPAGGTHTAAAPAAPDSAAAATVATAPRSPAAARGPVPRDLMVAFGEAYAARFGVPHPKMGGQEAALAKVLLEQYGLSKCLEFVDAFFTLRDPWLERTGKGFSIFASKNTITKLIALPTAVSVGRAASISEKWAGAKPGLVAL